MTEGKATALLMGIPLSFFALPGLALLLRDWASPLLWPLTAAAFGVAGVAHGYLFPADGWRLGLYLGLIHLLLIPFGFLLSGNAMVRREEGVALLLLDVAVMAAPVFAACLGATVGALVKEHRSAGA